MTAQHVVEIAPEACRRDAACASPRDASLGRLERAVLPTVSVVRGRDCGVAHGCAIVIGFSTARSVECSGGRLCCLLLVGDTRRFSRRLVLEGLVASRGPPLL